MLTDLSFIEPGQSWPPPSERDRLHRYAYNRSLFANDCDEKYQEQAKRIQQVIGDYQEIVSYHIALNYPKCVSMKTADLLLGEPPKIKAGEKTKVLDTIIARSSLVGGPLRETVLDISMCGDLGIVYAIVRALVSRFWGRFADRHSFARMMCFCTIIEP